jgi:Peptidase S24-like.
MEKRILPNDILLAEAGALLAEGRDVELLVKGNSMLPFLHDERDSVRLRKLDTVAKGDIVLAQISPGNYVLHRVRAVDGEKLTLMGDGNVRGTERCTRADVLGTAVEFIRPDGTRRKPGRGRCWAVLRPIRRYLLYLYRKIVKTR